MKYEKGKFNLIFILLLHISISLVFRMTVNASENQILNLID